MALPPAVAGHPRRRPKGSKPNAEDFVFVDNSDQENLNQTLTLNELIARPGNTISDSSAQIENGVVTKIVLDYRP